MTKRKASWVVRARPVEAAPRLVCFPSAGNGAALYRDWYELAGGTLDVCCVLPPGRESRLFEPAHASLETLLDAMLPELVAWLDRPFSVFGHSLGSLVAFAFTRRLRDLGARLPVHLFVSSRRAPHLPLLHPPLHALPDGELVSEIRRYNGTPDAILSNAELMELLLPTLRADFRIHETYVHEDASPLEVPITAFGGLSDPGVPRDGLEAWREHTHASFDMRMFPGDHFYLNEHKRDVLAVVRAAIGSSHR